MVIYGTITLSIPLDTRLSLIPRGGKGLVLALADINVRKKPQLFSPNLRLSPAHFNSYNLIAARALAVAASVVISLTPYANALDQQQQQADTLENIPQLLSGECVLGSQDCKKTRIQRPKSKQAESCTVKCVNTCIRGGYGAPGEGPLNVRRPLVVFKQGFRSRQYCLVECSDICNLIKDGEDGP